MRDEYLRGDRVVARVVEWEVANVRGSLSGRAKVHKGSYGLS